MRRTIRRIISGLGWVAAVLALALLALVLIGGRMQREFIAQAAEFPLERLSEVPERSAIYDSNGDLYSHLPGLNRQVVAFDQVSGWFVQALLAREDSGFWQHNGIELRSIARAAVANLRGGGIRQGASTITQQLARNAFELSGRTYQRKALEAALAVRIEKNFSKKQILELYMNRVYFGSGLYGIEAAARGYFGKPAAELSLGESAILAGLICSPNRFSPARHPEQAVAERDEVLERMLHENMIAPQDVAAARALRVETMSKPAFHTEDDYVTDAVIRGVAEVLDPEVIERGGLRVTITIDPQLQKLAEAAADRRLTEIEAQKKYPHPKRADFVAETDDKGVERVTNYLQAAVVVVDNRTSAIRVCVGGRDYQESKYHRALLSQRQIGSTFKPFVYAAAFERGLLPGTLVSDDKIAPREYANIPKNWSPDNSDGSYLGLQPAAVGLVKSRNTMSVRVGEMVGLPAVRKLAEGVGVGEKMPDYPVSFLGAFETTVKNLTAAYTVFPNAGVYREPYLIAKVENQKGETLYTAAPKERRVMRPETAWEVTTCLHEVMKTGTAAKSAQLGWKKPAAGKTGTTNDFHDAWFVGYTQSLTCGVWVGMDRPETIMEKGYGSALALPIWVDVMQGAPEQLYPAPALSFPIAVSKVRLCSVSGGRAGSGCEAAHTAYDAELPNSRVPQHRCPRHAEIPVAPPALASGSGLPAAPVESRGGAQLIPGLEATQQTRVEVATPAPVRQPTPMPPAYATAPAPPAPPLVMNGVRMATATPFPSPAGGGARPYANVSGAPRLPERDGTVSSGQIEQGVRVVRAYPPETAAPLARLRTRTAEPSTETVVERPIIDRPPVAERDQVEVNDDASEADRRRESGERRPGLFRRIFGHR
jgi:penicillin-binding protein 1A